MKSTNLVVIILRLEAVIFILVQCVLGLFLSLKDVFNPDEWTEEDYYDKLSEAQKKAHEMKQRARAERSKVREV